MTNKFEHVMLKTADKNSHEEWWESTVFYEIYIASFQDGNDDGIGDFKGLISRLDYLKDLGVRGLWITPFYPSPKVDNGYDVSNYFDVDPDFGSLADFDLFIKEAHQRNIKVIIDVVLNHVSTEHWWFKEAISSIDNKYRDYFIFKDKNKTNNWESFFGGSSWEEAPGGQCYYHKFSVEQADLNWQNPAVKNEMIDMLKFWLNRGVDGFRLDVINFLSCSDNFLDNSKDNPKDSNNLQIHQHDIDQPGIYACIAEICKQVRVHSESMGKRCFLVGEVGHDDLSKLCPYQREDLLDVIFNFNLGSLSSFDINKIYHQLVLMEKQQLSLPTIFFNSHDMARSMSRLCDNNVEQAKALAALTLTLRGVCFLYFGEEIGMPDFETSSVQDFRDIQAKNHFKLILDGGGTQEQAFIKAKQECRDKSRLFMQWDTSEYSGFSRALPWIGPSKSTMPNVVEQQYDMQSLWHWYKDLIWLRNNSLTLAHGTSQEITLYDSVFSISRSYQEESIHILINFNAEAKAINFQPYHEVLVSYGFDSKEPDWLLPYGVLITREK